MPVRRLRFALPALAAALALPATAHAAQTYVVDPAAAGPGCTGTTCKTIRSALAATLDGDTVKVKPGVYEESAGLEITKPGVTLETEGAPGTALITHAGVTTAGTPVLKVGAAGATVRGLFLSVPVNGGPALDVVGAGTGAKLESLFLVNETATTQDLPTLRIAASSGTTTVDGLLLVHRPATTATDAAAPAVLGPAASTVTLIAANVLAGDKAAAVVRLPGGVAGATHRIASSNLVGARSNGVALEVLSAADSPAKKQVRMDSTFLSAASGGTGLRAASAAAATGEFSQAGDIAVSIVRSTVAGAGRATVLQAQANGDGTPVMGDGVARGNIDVTVTRSILKGDNQLTDVTPTSGLFAVSNDAKLTITQSDTPQAAKAKTDGTGEIVVASNTNTPDAQLFVAPSNNDPTKRSFRLRADAPLIDKGGSVAAEEPAKDADGQARTAGPAADVGADEFVNLAPVAALKDGGQVAAGKAVLLDGSASADPEAGIGGGLKSFRWEFGDGQTQTTTTPTVQHTYAKPGTYEVKLVVEDSFGALSAAAATTKVTVADGAAPLVAFTSPKSGARFTRFITKRNATTKKVTRTARTLRFAGTASDDAAVGKVELALRAVTLKGVRRLATGQCRFLDVKAGKFVGNQCRKPKLFVVAFKDGKFAYRTKRGVQLRPGTYEVIARATDAAGNVGTTTTRFTIR
jgi:hypothetical protein